MGWWLGQEVRPGLANREEVPKNSMVACAHPAVFVRDAACDNQDFITRLVLVGYSPGQCRHRLGPANLEVTGHENTGSGNAGNRLYRHVKWAECTIQTLIARARSMA